MELQQPGAFSSCVPPSRATLITDPQSDRNPSNPPALGDPIAAGRFGDRGLHPHHRILTRKPEASARGRGPEQFGTEAPAS